MQLSCSCIDFSVQSARMDLPDFSGFSGPRVGWVHRTSASLGSRSRVARAATQELTRSGFIEHATASGERPRRVLLHEILPNITDAILSDIGLRIVGAIYLISAAGFLGSALPRRRCNGDKWSPRPPRPLAEPVGHACPISSYRCALALGELCSRQHRKPHTEPTLTMRRFRRSQRSRFFGK